MESAVCKSQTIRNSLIDYAMCLKQAFLFEEDVKIAAEKKITLKST